MTYSPIVCHAIGRVDRESHRHHGVTAVDRRQRGGLRAGSSKSHTVPKIRQRILTYRLRVCHAIRRVDHQGHRHHGVATVNRLERNGRVASGIKGNLVPSIRQFAFTNGIGICHRVGRIDHERLRDHRVAAVNRLQSISLRTSFDKGDTVPSIRQRIWAYRLRVCHAIGRFNDNRYRIRF